MQILLSEAVYNLMSLKARHTLRKIDVITMKEYKECKEPIGMYAFDLSFANTEEVTIEETHQVGDLIKLQQYETINIKSFERQGVDYMFTLDSDIVGLQHHIQEFNPIFRQALKSYIMGDWETATTDIERCVELWDNDGPTKALKNYMAVHNYEPPEAWNGYRNIDEVVNVDSKFSEVGLNESEEEELDGINSSPEK